MWKKLPTSTGAGFFSSTISQIHLFFPLTLDTCGDNFGCPHVPSYTIQKVFFWWLTHLTNTNTNQIPPPPQGKKKNTQPSNSCSCKIIETHTNTKNKSSTSSTKFHSPRKKKHTQPSKQFNTHKPNLKTPLFWCELRATNAWMTRNFTNWTVTLGDVFKQQEWHAKWAPKSTVTHRIQVWYVYLHLA